MSPWGDAWSPNLVDFRIGFAEAHIALLLLAKWIACLAGSDILKSFLWLYYRKSKSILGSCESSYYLIVSGRWVSNHGTVSFLWWMLSLFALWRLVQTLELWLDKLLWEYTLSNEVVLWRESLIVSPHSTQWSILWLLQANFLSFVDTMRLNSCPCPHFPQAIFYLFQGIFHYLAMGKAKRRLLLEPLLYQLRLMLQPYVIFHLLSLLHFNGLGLWTYATIGIQSR